MQGQAAGSHAAAECREGTSDARRGIRPACDRDERGREGFRQKAEIEQHTNYECTAFDCHISFFATACSLGVSSTPKFKNPFLLKNKIFARADYNLRRRGRVSRDLFARTNASWALAPR